MDDLALNNVAAVAAAKNIRLPAVGVSKHKFKMLACMETGDIGEELVARLEQTRLAGTGYESRVSIKPAKNSKNGYDVISATEDGRPKYIEVKTTTSPDPDEPFHMTDAEYRKLKDFFLAGAVYELYRVYDLNTETMDYRYVVYTPQEVIDLFEPVPESYLMVRKEGHAR